MTHKQRIDEFFEKAARTLYSNPKKVLLLLLIVIGLLVSTLPSLTVDTSIEGLLHKKDPQIITYNRFRDTFGREEFIVIAIRSQDIFTESFFNTLKHLHEDLLGGVPHLKSVSSLVNARDIYGKNDTVHVEKLIAKWPENGMTVADIKQRVLSDPVLVNNMISEDGTCTTITLETAVYRDEAKQAGEQTFADFGSEDVFNAGKTKGDYLTVEDNHAIVAAIQTIVDRYRIPGREFFIAGSPVVSDTFNTATINDAALTSVLALAAITFFLAILFRRISGVFLAWIIVLSALFCVYGLMAMFQVPIKLTTTIIPSFLLAVGVGDSVHILTQFYGKYSENCSKEDAIAYAMRHSGLAVVMTSVTTAAGLLSFSMAELAAIGDVGIFTAAGVMLALLFSLLMIPACVALLPLKPGKKGAGKRGSTLTDTLFLRIADGTCRYPWPIVAVCGTLLVVALIYTMNVTFSHDTVTWFPDSTPVKHDIRVIDDVFNGSVALEVVLDTGRDKGLYNYRLLNRIDRAATEIKGISSQGVAAGTITTINDIVKEVNKALHNNDDRYYGIPGNDKQVAENIFLFECGNSDDLDKITDSALRMTRMTIKTPSVDAVAYKHYIEQVKGVLEKTLPPGVHGEITGMTSLLSRTISATLTSMAESYFVAFGVITLMMILLIGDLKLGLASMFPNFLPIAMATGFMGWAGIPMDMCTIMVGSIAIGLVVDDTMHFMLNFQRSYRESGDGYQAVRETLVGTGRALLFTSLILCAGFYVVMFASLQHTVRFGFLLGSIIVLALLADILLSPAIVILMTRKRKA